MFIVLASIFASSVHADTDVPNLKLHDGKFMPALGLGTYRLNPGPETQNSVKWALEAGYRMIDTAACYQNEESVGRGIAESGIPREQIYVETKLWGDGHGYDNAMSHCRQSIDKLGTGYVDLYIIHAPVGGKLIETWDALLEMQKQGFVKSVGVSNFGIQHLQLLESHGRPLPVVNQVEMHPLVLKERQDLVDWCEKREIVVQAYGSLLDGQPTWLQDSRLKTVAEAKGKTSAQVLLRWGHQMGFHLIPKSATKSRIQENMDIFDIVLSSDEMDMISSMNGNLGAYWNPLNLPVDVGATHHWTAHATELLMASDLEPAGKRMDDFYPSPFHCALAIFLLTVIGLQKFQSNYKQAKQLKEPMLYS